LGGSRWAQPAQQSSDRGAMRARAIAAGVTAQQARRLPRAPGSRSRGPASLRPTCHQAQRMARRSSRPEHSPHSGGPAAGVAGGRGDDLARTQQTKRSATQWSAAPCASSGPVRRAGLSVAYPRRTSGPRSPATGRVAFVRSAGAAGLAALRKGWQPGRGETRRGSTRSATARPAQRDSPWLCTMRSVGDEMLRGETRNADVHNDLSRPSRPSNKDVAARASVSDQAIGVTTFPQASTRPTATEMWSA
jgi:hypothetical protein